MIRLDPKLVLMVVAMRIVQLDGVLLIMAPIVQRTVHKAMDQLEPLMDPLWLAYGQHFHEKLNPC